MSAENAWRIAKEAAAECADRCECPERLLEVSPFFFSGTEAVGDSLRALPMPPAFRAEVEAEAEELREALGRIRDETLMGVSHGLGDRIYSIASGALSRLEAKGESHE